MNGTRYVSKFAPSKLLCPLDLGAESRTVLGWVRLFGEAFAASVELLHAAWPEYPPYFLPSQETDLQAKAAEHRAALAETLRKLAQDALSPAVPFRTEIEEGYPEDVILGRAAATQPDLIVMGSHGRRGFSRLRLGSVAESIVRSASVPTLIVKARPEAGEAKIARILCPVNLPGVARRALNVAAGLAGAFHAKLFVLNVVEGERLELSFRQQELCDWIPAEVRNQCTLSEAVRHGNPAEQILLAAREDAADMIVMDTRHRPFLDLSILDTVTERVMRHAESAVLAVPDGGRKQNE